MTTMIDSDYRDRTVGSRLHYEQALAALPAGATRSLNSWPPYPVYLTGGRGSLVTDVDGRDYVDMLNNYSALILGHADPEIVDVVSRAAALGTSFSFSTPAEHELAEVLRTRIPSLERLRFAGSGTEAAMFCLRLARARTGRDRIAKMEGGFHGTYDDVAISIRPSPDSWGPPHAPASVPDMDGLPEGTARRVLVLPFNDTQATSALLRLHGNGIAAVIVEPVLGVGGMIPATPEYLRTLRELCDELGIVLIFDEVISLRVARGGAQESYGVTPDLTVMGKVIGGGLPIGAYGGRADIMGLLEPQGGSDVYDPRAGGPRLYQGGTFTGSPCSLATGLVTMRRLTPAVYAELAAKGDQLRAGLGRQIERHGLPACVTGHSSLFNIHVGAGQVSNFRDARRVDGARQQALFLGLLSEGFIIAPRGMGAVSTATSSSDIDAFTDAAAAILARI